MMLYAVYTQYDPTYKHEPHLECVWEVEEDAIEYAKTLTSDDHVWVEVVQTGEEFRTGLVDIKIK